MSIKLFNINFEDLKKSNYNISKNLGVYTLICSIEHSINRDMLCTLTCWCGDNVIYQSSRIEPNTEDTLRVWFNESIDTFNHWWTSYIRETYTE